MTDRAVYAADLSFSGMLYGGCLRSPYGYARIRSIDVHKARGIAGVHVVLTSADVPKARSWADYPYLAKDKVRYMGETVAIVTAETREILQDALTAIQVEYEKLDGVYSIEDALRKDSPVIREDRGVGLVDGIPTCGTQGNIFLVPISRFGNVMWRKASNKLMLSWSGYTEQCLWSTPEREQIVQNVRHSYESKCRH